MKPKWGPISALAAYFLTTQGVYARYSKPWPHGTPSPTSSSGGGNSYDYSNIYVENAYHSNEGEHPSQTGSPSTQSTGLSSAPNGSVIANGDIKLPAGCSQVNGIGVGWLPSDTSLSTIESSLNNIPSCWEGQYAQIISGGAYTDSNQQLTGHLDDIKVPGKTIFVASVMPTIAMGSVDATVADGIAKVLKQFTDKGIEVWCRYAHEMNYYVREDSEGGHYTGNTNDFKSSWAAVSEAVKDNPMVKMFWSPNGWPGDWADWYPSAGQVDIVGLDVYPKKQQTFAETYGSFCLQYPTIPFVIGETGAGPQFKDYWWKQLISPDAKTACPNYMGFSWFEYDKEADFRVATNGETIAKDTMTRQRRGVRRGRRVRYV